MITETRVDKYVQEFSTKPYNTELLHIGNGLFIDPERVIGLRAIEDEVAKATPDGEWVSYTPLATDIYLAGGGVVRVSLDISTVAARLGFSARGDGADAS